jgi:hypothetical protein
MYMCPIQNCFRDRAISLCSALYTVQTSNTPCPHTSCKVHWCWRWNFLKFIIVGMNQEILKQTPRSTGPPLWYSGQSSWIEIQRSLVRYQIFWEVVGLERGPLSVVSTIEELLGRNSSGSGLENREYNRGDPFRWPRDSLSIRNRWH